MDRFGTLALFSFAMGVGAVIVALLVEGLFRLVTRSKTTIPAQHA